MPCFIAFIDSPVLVVQFGFLHLRVSSLIFFYLNCISIGVFFFNWYLHHMRLLWFLDRIWWNRSPPEIPETILPQHLFMRTAISLTATYNQALRSFRHVVFGTDIRDFLSVPTFSSPLRLYLCCKDSKYWLNLATLTWWIHLQVALVLWVLSVVGHLCSFLSFLYIGWYQLQFFHG